MQGKQTKIVSPRPGGSEGPFFGQVSGELFVAMSH